MTNKKITVLLTFALMLLGFSFSSFAQKSIELKYNLTKGDTYSYVMELDQDIVFEANGQTMALDMLMVFEMTQKISEVTADSIKLEGKIKRVKMSQAIFGMEMKYDTDDPVAGQNPMTAKMGEEFTKMLNKSFFMMMDHQGKLGNMDFSGVTENDEFANNVNSGSQFAVYPKGKIKVGDSWEEDIRPAETSDMKFHAKYTLLKISGKQATLGIDGIVSANNIEGANLKMEGTMKGEMIVDVKTGWLIESKLNQEIDMDIEQNGMKFPATISGTIITTSAKSN